MLSKGIHVMTLDDLAKISTYDTTVASTDSFEAKTSSAESKVWLIKWTTPVNIIVTCLTYAYRGEDPEDLGALPKVERKRQRPQ